MFVVVYSMVICFKQARYGEKGWEKCGLVHFFYSNFQKEALLENMKTPLFKLKTNEAMEMDSHMNIGEEETNAMESLDTMMIDFLTKVEKLSYSSSAPSMASLCEMARKK
jgi:hypothetical protein